MWKKRIIERDCEWTGVNGRDFNTNRWIECIFYTNEFKPSLSHGSDGAVIGGSGEGRKNRRKSHESCNGINKTGSKTV